MYPKKRGVRYNVELAKMLFSTFPKMSAIGWGSWGKGSSNSEAISIQLFAGVTRARSSPLYNRTTSSDAFRKSSRNVSNSESRLVPSPKVCLVIAHASFPMFLHPNRFHCLYRIAVLQLAGLGWHCHLISRLSECANHLHNES